MPTFESDSSSFFTTVYSVLYGRSEEDFQRVINQESTPKEEDTTQKIIDLLSEDPYLTRLDIALRLSLTPDGVKYHLNRLQKKGYLIRVEGRKNGHWKVLIRK